MREKSTTFQCLERVLSHDMMSTKLTSSRKGIEAWFPYYAGYSPNFVEETLNSLDLSGRATVLDPWNGSGTTTAVADRLGYDAIGFDINPVAVLVSSARLVRAQDALHSEGLVSEILAIADRIAHESTLEDPLKPWLSKRIRSRFRSIEYAILDLLGSRNGRRVNPTKDVMPPLASFLLLSLIRAAKTFTKTTQGTNPTWSNPKSVGDAKPNRLDYLFKEKVRECAVDVEKELIQSSTHITASYSRLADSRYLPLAEKSVDAVVTSPPYCTRLDYAKATEFELAALGIGSTDSFYRTLREDAMGTNLIRQSNDIVVSRKLPAQVTTLLKKIAAHPSKASKGYYLKHFRQYFQDAQRSIDEVERVLVPGGTAVFVIQSSYYKEIPIRLGDLYVTMAKNSGLRARIVHRLPVTKVISTINSRATKYLTERDYSEDVVAAVKAG